MAVPNSSARRDSSMRCPRCRCAFDCGSATQPFDCWCARLPPLPPATQHGGAAPVPAGGCLCPACYVDEIAATGGLGRGGSSAGSDASRENSTD